MPAGARAGVRSPLITQKLSPLPPGEYLGLPQVARAAFFAADDAASVLVTTPARLGLFEHLPVLGRAVACNPGVADWADLPSHVVLDIETAVKDFPADPNRYALELRPGEEYPRGELLDRLDALGYEREENLSAAELEKAEAWYTLMGDSLEVRFNERPGRPARTLRLEFDIDALERLRLGEGDGKLERVERFTLGPVGGFIPDTAWTATRLEALSGRKVYLDQPEFMSGYVTPQQWTRFTEALPERDLIAFGRLEGADLATPEPPVQALPYYRARLKAFGDDTQLWLRDGYTIVAFLRHERTSDYLQNHVLTGTPVSWEWRAEAEPGRVTFVQAALEGGFILHDQKLVVVTEELLYGFQGGVTLRARKLRGPPVSDATALSVGDYLIHPEHGIGQFMGLEARPVLGVTRDYLVLRYGSEARLYLPVEQLPSLRRHPGTTDDPPRLSTLGTNEWARAREKARQDAEELARKLLIQYAARAAAPGMSFPPVPGWDALIEQNFPFTLTPDQQSAIHAVFRDLQSPHPMDRLVSGDVGFGKTEVA
ncbi:MAG TPA: CarD family transcriptional regulator, partial [Deinococcales bacterium]|nr:CarD family transcriptional regulator [Deinococcales bacterium]